MNLTALGLAETARLVKGGEVSPIDIVKEYTKRIDLLDGKVHAFLNVFKDFALERAQALDEQRRRGELLGRLAGVTVAIKDNMTIKGKPTTCGSKILEGYRSTYTATAVRLLEDEGAIVLGKTNLDEFAMGSSTENSAYGPTRNPWNLDCVPGGSSGGSAAVVACSMAAAALGSDTGGSIRQPASFCGVTGFKPSYGAVSRYGLVAFASSLDQIGPFARRAADAALLYDVLSKTDKKDSTCRGDQSSFQEKNQPIRIGLPKEYLNQPGVDPQVMKALEDAVSVFKKEGAVIKEISLPNTRYALATYYIVAPSEASANLARFDGVRYGRRVESEDGEGALVELYRRSRTEGFGREVQRRIMLGTFALSHGYYDAYYGKAQQARLMITQDFDHAFKEVDFILAPTAPTPAFKIGEKAQDPVAMYLSDIYTIPVNLAGIPGVSVPCGFSSTGLPIGLQILGPRGSDRLVLSAAGKFEEWTSQQYIRDPMAQRSK